MGTRRLKSITVNDRAGQGWTRSTLRSLNILFLLHFFSSKSLLINIRQTSLKSQGGTLEHCRFRITAHFINMALLNIIILGIPLIFRPTGAFDLSFVFGNSESMTTV